MNERERIAAGVYKMFGLTKREQRMKAEQQIIGLALDFFTEIARIAADVRIAELHADHSKNVSLPDPPKDGE